MFHALEDLVDPRPWLDRPGRAARVLAVAGLLGCGAMARPLVEAWGWWVLPVLVLPAVVLCLGYAREGWGGPRRPENLCAGSFVFHVGLFGLAVVSGGFHGGGHPAGHLVPALGLWSIVAIYLSFRAWRADTRPSRSCPGPDPC